ncbi:hypothetical protein ACP70R_003685 [Stipagrostis hirtigluma subsp. patula]
MASLSSLFVGAAFLVAAAFYFRTYNVLGDGATTTTHLHFFMHDDYTGPRPTAMRVVSGRSLVPAEPNDGDDDDNPTENKSTSLSSSSPPRQFGDVVVLNNALTEGPDAGGSPRVGTAQGFAVRVSEGGVVSHLTLHLVVEAGEHRGSSVTASGRIDMDAAVRESVVVGGTGKFRFARGYMLTRNYDYSLARGGVVEIDVYLQH